MLHSDCFYYIVKKVRIFHIEVMTVSAFLKINPQMLILILYIGIYKYIEYCHNSTAVFKHCC